MGRFIKQPDKMSRFITQEMKSLITTHEPFEYEWTNEFYYGKDSLLGWVVSKLRGAESVMSKNKVSGQFGISYQKRGEKRIRGLDDYKTFIAMKSNGFTKTGQLLLQQSIESYVYCVLGAQAKTRWPIVGRGAMSIQTQEVCRRLFIDTTVQDGTTVMISNMRKAIKDTNVILNMAISPGIMLIPSNMIILNEMVSGYNNILTLAGKDMKFGRNDAVNYLRAKTEDNTKPAASVGGTQINTVSIRSTIPTGTGNTIPTDTGNTIPTDTGNTIPTDTGSTIPIGTTTVSNNPTSTYEADLYLLIVSVVGGVLISRYVI